MKKHSEMMKDQKVGRVTHFYDKIGVAVLELTAPLRVGDRIKFVRGGEDLFEQEVKSMQLEHKAVEEVKAGDEVGLKVDQGVKDAAEVFKINA